MPTKISWTNETLNVFAGCSKCSVGCQNCYAEKMARRLAFMGKDEYRYVVDWDNEDNWCEGWNGNIVFRPEQFDKLKHWKKPRLIFVNSMSDTFHEKAASGWIARIIRNIAGCRNHTFQILTKRAKRMYEYSKDYRLNLPNLRLGISISNQPEADEKIPYLLQTPAAFRFVSIEPMLGKIRLNRIKTNIKKLNCLTGKSIYPNEPETNYYGHFLNQIIIGCESNGQYVGRLGEFKSEAELIRAMIDLTRQAKEAGVKVFVKQIPVNGKVVKDIKRFPKELQYQEM